MKNILFPTDFSENSKRALDFAASIAAKAGANLMLVHAIGTGFGKPGEKKRILGKMDAIENELNFVYGKNLRCSTHFAKGKLEAVIHGFEKKIKLDLIVMGNRGAGNLTKRVFGSNTERMMEKAKCPLLVIPENFKVKKVLNIAYATDYSLPEIPIVKNIVKLAELFHSNLIFVHIVGEKEEDFSAMGRKYIREIKNKIDFEKLSYHFVKINDIARGISSFTNEYNIDILSMATHTGNKVKNLFYNSNTKSILKRTTIPLLIYHK